MIKVRLSYYARTCHNTGTLSNVVFEGIHGIGPTGAVAEWNGLSNLHIHNVVVSNISLTRGDEWDCSFVDNVTLTDVTPQPRGSCSQ